MAVAFDRLKKRRDFLAVAATDQKAISRSMVLQYKDNPELPPGVSRVGFTVTRKQGNAVVRNRIRRRLREAFRQAGPIKGHAGFDYVVIGRHAACDCPYRQIQSDMENALRKAHAAPPPGRPHA